MKYTVLGCYKLENKLHYAVFSEGAEEPEILNESDLKLLLVMDMKMYDSSDNQIRVENNIIVGDIPDVTNQLYAEFEEEEDDYEDYEDYEEEVDWGSTEDFDLDDDDYEEEEVIEGFEEPEEDEEELYVEDEDDYDWDSEEDEIDTYYRAWKQNADVLPEGQAGVDTSKKEKDFSSLEDSTESKLYKHLSETQKKLLQEYYLYISKRIFNLERGVNNLPVKRKKDLDAIRNTGDSWVYAGFLDMGYAGTSLCPYCGAPLAFKGLSDCHKAPIVRWSVPRGKKATPSERKLMRTYNGVCSYPGCRQHCSVVTDEVGVRNIDRSNQHGVVCESCGNAVPQSSHYCTFNDPVRYMHVAWDISISDMDHNFYGQFANEALENLIDSNNCIKFGLTCTAEFFDIAKNSAAFKALENVQNVCKKDMELLQEEYEKGEVNCRHINSSFTFLDAIVDKLILLSSKIVLLKGEELLPGRLLSLYKEMRKEEMVIPKSFIQFVRDFLVDWDVHKFIDLSKKFPQLRNSVGNLAGAKAGTSEEPDCYKRLSEVLKGVFGKRANAACEELDVFAGGSRYSSYRYDYAGGFTSKYRLLDYIIAMFIYKVCGYYQYDAVTQGDEGGKDGNHGVGKHGTNLRYFYSGIERALPSDMVWSYEYLLKVLDMLTIFKKLHEFKQISLVTKCLGVRLVKSEKGTEYKEYYIYDADGYSPRSVVYPCKMYDNGKIMKLHDDVTIMLSRLHSASNTDAWLTEFKEWADYADKCVKEYPEFEIKCLEQEMEKRNREELERVEELESETESMDFDMPDFFGDDNTETESEPEPEEGAKTVEEALKYLYSQDLSGYKDKKWEFAQKLVAQLKKSGGVASAKQFFYIKPFYEEVSGKTYSGVVQNGDAVTAEELKAIDYVIANPDTVDDFVVQVAKTIKSKGKVSPKQKRYLDKAVKAYNSK